MAGRRKNKNKPRGAARAAVWHKVTEEQYELGWRLFAANQSVASIVATTGLTIPLYKQLCEHGDPTQGWESYRARAAKLTADFREQEQLASRHMALWAAKTLEREQEIVTLSQGVAMSILSRFGARVRAALDTEIVLNDPEDDADDWGDTDDGPPMARGPKERRSPFAMSLGERETLKVLRQWADPKQVGTAMRALFGGDGTLSLDPLAKPRQKLTPAESARPALMEASESRHQTVDPLDDLLGPEHEDWSEEEVDTYSETGEAPARMTHVTKDE